MAPQFMPKNFASYQCQSDIIQQETISCPVTPPLTVTDQLTPSLLSLTPRAPTTAELPTIELPTTELPSHQPIEDTPRPEIEAEKGPTKKPGKLPLAITLAIIGLVCAAYFIWRTLPTNSSSAPLLSQSFSTSTNKGNTTGSTTDNTSTILVYVTGAVQNPGVYTLSSDARIYQLLQAAGGPLPDANLVTLNLAQKLVDGQEIYVSLVQETPPTLGSTTNKQGQLVNINTASTTDLQQKLHLSTKSAQDIVTYRQQYGPFSSIDDLLQVVSKTIYDKIKDQTTI